jgi:glycosyltransferase-like protein
MMTGPLRVALFTHSVNPRGGVSHALSLAEALDELGHEAIVHAPDADARGFYRPPRCGTVAVPATRIADGDTTALVEARIADYVRWLQRAESRRFDVFHAQDGISGNALADLKQAGRIARFARTVHHVDDFADRRLEELQHRAIATADAHFTVSRLWRDDLRLRVGVEATVVGNGVDLARFRPEPDGREGQLKLRLGLGSGPVVLAVGGVEDRKNTLRLLAAFLQIRLFRPEVRLVIVGGASLLDHGAYQARFAQALAEARLPSGAVVLAGPLPDADMPALYRIASLLAFPSLTEGFGLATLEALASGLPVLASRIPPFTEYLGPDEVVWCDPRSEGSIANALMAALSEPLSAKLARGGPAVAARHSWRRVAEAHLAVYRRLAEPAYA